MLLGGIRRRIFLIVFVTLIPAVISSVFLIAYFARARSQSQQVALVANTLSLVAAVEAEVERHAAIGSMLAAAWPLTGSSLDKLYDLAQRTMEAVPESWLIVVDKQGQQLLNTRSDRNRSLPRMPVTDAQAKAVQSGNWQLSDIVTDTFTNKAVVGIYLPLSISNSEQASLFVVLNPDILATIMRSNNLPEGWLNGVIDTNGRFIARNLDHERLIGTLASEGWRNVAATGENRFFETVSVEGNRTLTYTHRLTNQGWSVAVGASRAMLWAPVGQSIWLLAALTSAFTAISVALAYLFGRQITGPILDLKEAATQLNMYGPEARQFRDTGVPEVDSALGAFSHASALLAERDRRQGLLVGELGHRVKNILAIVQAIAKLSARSAGSLEGYIQEFEQRLMGISRTHDLLVRGAWSGADLRELLEGELRSFLDDRAERIQLEGGNLHLSPNMTWSLCLVVHELATNAAKYGSLSVPDGRLQVLWSERVVDNEPRLYFEWNELDGPAVQETQNTSFGFKLIKRIVEQELYGQSTADFRSAGLRFTMDVKVLAEAASDESSIGS